jgi:uncharacterized damage-inducible protein DinB
MKQQITSLFEYEKWANARILDGISQLKEPDEKMLDIMSHILLVQMVWYSRMAGVAAPPVWEKKSLQQCKEIYAVNNKILEPFIAKQTKDTITSTVDYKNTKGEKYSNTVLQILTHLFNHSTYHRGQIVERLKSKIAKMPETDYIVFLRQK